MLILIISRIANLDILIISISSNIINDHRIISKININNDEEQSRHPFYSVDTLGTSIWDIWIISLLRVLLLFVAVLTFRKWVYSDDFFIFYYFQKKDDSKEAKDNKRKKTENWISSREGR